MLRLERVEIAGFKSFYDKVDLAFPGRVTAVVGPNGCGKSNICDAVAWALGEQSARVLRGERMDDVIFNGSSKRRPLGMAEVILTLANGNGNGDSEGGQLRIGRRVFRDGEGEYFLNDKQVRFKDVQDRLLGTGLSVRAYSVIEQGRIDQVLSTKPQDRRRLIEEAAGITKYKVKRRLAEVKLEETRGNLLRLSDIVNEVERNCASLKRQASRAARHRELSEALRGRRAGLARVKSDRLTEALETAERLHGQRRDAEAAAAAALGQAEADLAAARLAAGETAAERDRIREALAAIEAAIERDDSLLESNRRAAADLAARREASQREGRDFSGEQAHAGRELAEQERRLERAVAEARARSLAREEADRKAADAAQALTRLETDLEAAREDALRAAGERIAARNARHELELAAERAGASLSRLDEALTKLARDLEERAAEVARSEPEAGTLREEAARASAQLRRLEEEAGKILHEIAAADSARDAGRASLAALEERAAALLEMAGAREGSLEAAREALASAGIAGEGTLSDRIRPVPGWERAVERALGADLEALLARGDGRSAAAAVRRFGGARLLRSDWQVETEPLRVAAALGFEAVIENFGLLSPAERAALPRAAFVEALEDALPLAERHPDLPFVSREGDVVRGPIVRLAGGLSSDASASALHREREEIAGRGNVARRALDAVEGGRANLFAAREDRETELAQARERERRAQSDLSAVTARQDEKRAERDRLRREGEAASAEREAFAREAALLASRRRALEEEESRRDREENAARERAEPLAAALPEARSGASAAAEELAHRRTEAEVAAERRRSLEAAVAALQESGRTLERRLREALEERERIETRTRELAGEEEEVRQRRERNVLARAGRAAEREAATRAAEEAAARSDRSEESTRASRAALDSVRQARFESEVEATRAASDLEHLIGQTREEFGKAPGDLEAPADRSEEALAKLEAEALEFTASLERLGPVNLLAWDEHRAESERLVFLTTQRDDLVKSVAELQDSIRKINATSAERFSEAFAAINANFAEMFTRLFRGGTAEMRLLDENDPLESGLEIIAQPPGKRNQSILLLSGGEKALTAIALLMGIFRYRPSPFCILDEVDAPLDEANIDRFTGLLRDMTEETQFIAITHNKRTMETADVMYGVTMEEPGCSKIVSVKFD